MLVICQLHKQMEREQAIWEPWTGRRVKDQRLLVHPLMDSFAFSDWSCELQLWTNFNAFYEKFVELEMCAEMIYIT